MKALICFSFILLITGFGIGQPKNIWVNWECNLEIEILSGRFTPGLDTVAARGAFNGWGRFDLIVDPINPNHYVSPYPILFSQLEVGDTVTFYKFFYTPMVWETDPNKLYVITLEDYNNGVATISRAFNDGTFTTVTNQETEITFEVDCNNAISYLDGQPFPVVNTCRLAGGTYPLRWPGSGWPDGDIGLTLLMYDDGTHGDLIAGDKKFTTKVIFPIYTPFLIQYKFGINYGDWNNNGGGNDNEAGYGNDHFIELSQYMISAKVENLFGTMGYHDLINIIVVPPLTFSLSVDVVDGPNMVSIPGLHPTDQNVNTWWPFRDLTANVLNYSNGYQTVTTATPGTGYWMKHSGNRTYNTGDEWPVSGIQIVSHDPITAEAGWNIIGGYEDIIATSNITTTPPNQISGIIYKYSGGYYIAPTLEPGYGYWIKLLSACQINLPEGNMATQDLFAKASGKVEDYFKENWGRIILTDAKGTSYTLYSVKDEIDLNNYELPPVPPEDLIDIRFGSGRIAEDLSNIQTIEMQGIAYPITIKTEGLSITLQDETEKIVYGVVSTGNEVIISNSSVKKLVILSANVENNPPTVYSLDQNYPNPFNPSTKISWQLPVGCSQTLKIYDVLGNEVATLVDEYNPAGKYEVEWDASSYPSGVYFYQLKTDEYISTKKMILLK
jgi:hypothetical protein